MAAGPCSFTGASPVLPPKLGELLSKSCAFAGRACGLAVLHGGGHPLPALETTVDRFHGGLGVAKDLFAWGDPAKEQGFEDLPVFDAESARKEAKGMKVAELREELKAMGQSTEGTKPELIERLVSAHQAEADSEDEEMDTEKKGCAEGAPLLNKLDESASAW